MYMQKWIAGTRVTVDDWYEDNKIWIHFDIYTKSTAVDRPDHEFYALLPREEEDTVRNYLDSITRHLVQQYLQNIA